MFERLGLFPAQASTMAARVDALYGFLIAVSVFFGLLIAGLLIVFAVRYRRRADNERAEQIEGSLQLESLWTLIPFAISMVIFVWGASVFFAMARPPDDALEMFVVGKQWMWKVQHLEGRREINELHVPLGRPVRLTMTSEDVIHSFYVPAFRVKADVLPDRYSSVWFEATRTGTFHLFCAEYCGTQHSLMGGRVIVMEQADYQRWLAAGPAAGAAPELASAADMGRAVFERQGCPTCHLVADAEPALGAMPAAAAPAIGPSLVGLFGSEVTLADGSRVVADAEYLRESVLEPMAKLVRGYDPAMPTYRGRIGAEEMLQLVAYLRSLEAPERGDGLGSEESEPQGS